MIPKLVKTSVIGLKCKLLSGIQSKYVNMFDCILNYFEWAYYLVREEGRAFLFSTHAQTGKCDM